jgi:hypothetical protein
MSTHSINGMASSYIQPVLNPPVFTPSPASASAAPAAVPSDQSQISPFAQMMNTLQQLQQSDPTEYKRVTAQIATGLETAAKTATADGNTAAATQLTTLATDFTTASTSGQPLPTQNVAKTIGGKGHGHHHHHGGGGGSSSASSSSSAASSTSSSASSPINQLLTSLQAGSSQSDTLNPMSIIASVMSSAGLTSNS